MNDLIKYWKKKDLNLRKKEFEDWFNFKKGKYSGKGTFGEVRSCQSKINKEIMLLTLFY